MSLYAAKVNVVAELLTVSALRLPPGVTNAVPPTTLECFCPLNVETVICWFDIVSIADPRVRLRRAAVGRWSAILKLLLGYGRIAHRSGVGHAGFSKSVVPNVVLFRNCGRAVGNLDNERT
jgi:hypothetical protein